MTGRRALAAALLVLVAGGPALAAGVPEPPGFRTENYKAPVPATLEGARVIDPKEAEAAWRAGDAVFVDVLPRPPKPDLPAGTVWREPPHESIPGSVWLPDVGYGALSPAMESWFAESLARIAGGDAAKPLVIFCKADCWMSWNAARRAVRLGYGGISWFPEGVEGWAAAGLPLEARQPEPRPVDRPEDAGSPETIAR